MAVSNNEDVSVALDRAGAEVMRALLADTDAAEADHRHRAQGFIGNAIRAVSGVRHGHEPRRAAS